MSNYWEYDLTGNMSDGQYESKEAAQDAVYDEWTESIDEDSPQNNETFTDTATIYYVDEDGEVIREEPYDMEYEYYHGDLAEHGLTLGDVL